MKKGLLKQARRRALLLSLLLPLQCVAEQFVELTAEIEINDWSYWFLADEQGLANALEAPSRSIFTRSGTVRCVVGTNTWQIEQAAGSWKRTYWFTRTNVIEQTVATNQIPYTTVSDSADGNPGRPVRVADRMAFDMAGRVCWLAFCSGPALKREGRQIYPPSDFWKESSLVWSGWSDKTTVFEDNLGLPKSIRLSTTNNQCVVQYQARQTTNVLGWNFPREFYLVQYRSGWPATNSWELQLTAKGRVTAIGIGTQPQIPTKMKINWHE
jgi:hypothetical protein